MAEQRETRESSQERVQRVFESLLKGSREARAEQAEGGEAWLEDRIADLPERAKGKIRAYERKLNEAGVAEPGKLAELVEEKITAFEQTYQDRRFTVGEGEHMLNKGFAKEQAVTYLKEILGDSPEPEDLKKIALLNFDANGLKAVNDLSASHEKGTEYLKRIAEVLFSKDSPEAARLKELGVTEVLPVTAGGDEYSILLKSEKPIPPDAINEALGLYEAAIARVDVSDLIDFNDERTILRYAGVTEKQFEDMEEDERRKTLEVARKEVPPGFTMRASAPGGGATLYEGMLSAMEHATKPLTPEDGFSRAVDKIVGGMWDAADRPALENKNHFKAGLRLSDASAEDKFYGKVLARTSELRVLEAKVEGMEKGLAFAEARQKEMDALEELAESGAIDAAQYMKMSREIQKRYKGAQA